MAHRRARLVRRDCAPPWKRADERGDVTSNPESKQAEELIRESFPPQPTPSEIVIVRSDRYTVDDPAFQAKVQSLGERGENRRCRGKRTATTDG